MVKKIQPTGPKYNIAARLDKMGNRIRLDIRTKIMRKTGCGASTYRRWMLLRKGEKADIPGEALILFSNLIGVPCQSLLNSQSHD